MYVNLDKQFLEKTKEEANKDAIADTGDEGKNELLYAELTDELENFEITDDEISVAFSNKLGYFSVTIPIDADALEQLISVTIKRMNKIKTLLETLK